MISRESIFHYDCLVENIHPCLRQVTFTVKIQTYYLSMRECLNDDLDISQQRRNFFVINVFI